MWGIGIVCLLLSLLVQLVIDVVPAEAAKDETRLRVSVRMEALQGVSSCVHAFSQVELLNLDETEPIVIHSVELTQEEVTNIKTKENVKDTVPQQIHISYLSELTLGPKQVAVVPMTFLPRFPESSAAEPSAAADNSERRNNLGYQANADEFRVQTSIALDTSRGVLNLPIEASSVRKNGYHIPDVIHFRPESEPSDSPTIGDGTNEHDDCFDVHLSNPFEEKGLQIFDVVVSRPDLLKMYVQEEETSDTALTEMFKNWEGEEQRSIAPGVSDEYVITLCPRKAGESVPEEMLKRKGGLSRTSELNDGLGYLQIRTDANVLIVNLEETTEGGVKADAPVVSEKITLTESKEAPTETERKVEPAETCSENAFDTAMPNPDEVAPPKDFALSVTEAPHIEIQLVPYVSPSFVKTVELRNTSPYPIKVMRSSLKMDFVEDAVLMEAARDVGLTIDAKIGKRNMAMISSDPHLLDEIVILTCIVQSSSSRVDSDKPLRFTGSVHVAASADADTSYNEWSENVKNNPQKDAQLSMVFPFAINVMDRQVHVVLDASSLSKVPSSWRHETVISGGVKSLTGLFYPISRSEGRLQDSGSKSVVEPVDEEISYNLIIVSPVGRPLSVAKMEVVEGNVEQEKQNANNLCHRFTLSSFNTFSTPARVANTSLFGLGKATLKYNFGRVAEPQRRVILYEGKAGMGIDDGAVIPETCHLQILTDSADGGKLSIPLILFSGKLDVTFSQYDISVQGKEAVPEEKAAIAPSIITGFDEIVNWLRSSTMGSSLKKVLKPLFDNRTTDVKAMFAAYMAGLSTESLSTDHYLLPILLNVGSVVHDEVQTFPLYLANHNPVPVEVSTDVGEVEGMSISLAREFSYGKGDGNGLLDRLPEEGNVKSEKVARGRWKGHSRRGLHNFLLMSSEFPQTVSSNLQYRDDVSLSPAAAEIQPILRTLYRKKDVGYFHAESAPRDVRSSEASGCPGFDLNPPGYSEDGLRLNDTYPMIMSDSLSFARRLSVCRDSKKSDNRLPERNATSHVLIPPGGVARFEVKLRCPSRRVLDSDITHFLATGLVLSTDYGQVMPIVANFEALLGHLQISTVPSSEVSVIPQEGSYEETIIDVSPGLFLSQDSSGLAGTDFQKQTMETTRVASFNKSVALGKDAGRVPLFITSTFTREVALSNVGSCNPWFDVRLLEHGIKNETPKVDAGEKLEIGTVRSTIPCQPFQYSGGSDEFRLDLPGERPRFPSFYECALEWLQDRFKLQPRGCGLARNTTEGSVDDDNQYTEDEVLTLATEALRKVVHYSLIHFNDGIPRRHKRSPSSGGGNVVDKEQERPAGDTSAHLENQAATSDKDLNAVQSSSNNKLARPESSYIPRVAVDLFAQLNNAWRLVTRSGLNVLSANLRAQIDYSHDTNTNSTQKENNALDRKKSQTLSVEMREVAIRTFLEIPTLVDHSRSAESLSRKIDGSELSTLQFPPTRIADVASLTIPLRNPTPVPIRVRLAAFTKSHHEDVADKYDDIGFNFFVSSDVRDRYLDRYSPVYVQNENIKDQPIRGDAQHWWEGGGGFFLPDDRGDLIQARYNLSITAGPGAHISLVNPSLHAFNGLSMSCGTRCGIREDAGQGKNGMVEQSSQPTMKQYSPIGASSASGMTLLGHPRPEKSPLNPLDRFVAAGGSTPADPAHLAFAIPYSSLDEIVLPPYGTGELGPILFRPPGRHSLLGCGAAVESQGNHSDGTFPRECTSNAFESLVFLENSLTGLERLVVRGHGMWESVVFLDPALSEASPFGNLEYRYGRSTLVFSGSTVSESSRRTSVIGPARKEVVVHNDGDVPVEFGRVYFSQAPDIRLNSPVLPRSLEWSGRRNQKTHRPDTDMSSSCQWRGFHLLDCSESELNGDRMINLRHGFALNPGQNLSLFVEHYPDCAFNTEYITLNLEYREGKGNRTSWSTGPSRSRHRAAPRKDGKLKSRKLELLVGFEMSANEMASCVPVSSAERRNKGDKHRHPLSACPGLNATKSQERHNFFKGWLVFSAVRIVLLCSSAFVAVCVLKQHMLRDTACLFFQSNLRGVNVDGSPSKDASPSLVESDWSAAFRCLARADPLSSELQAVGREQARQLVLDRFKSMGVMTPQCISSAGVLLRDRSGVIGAGGRGGGVMSGSEKRAVTLSDAMFRGAFTDQGADSDIDQLLPCSLGWRAAGTKGLVRKLSHASKSKEILAKRKASLSAGHENGSEEAKRREEREYADTRAQQIPKEAVPVTDEGDEHKGDVVSTSESEGTTGALKEVECPTEEDFSGFAKVGSQKGKSTSRDKNRKKQSEGNAPSTSSERRKAKSQKEAVNDTSNVSVTKQKIGSRTKQHQVTPQPQAQHGKGVANDVPAQQSRVPLEKKKTAAKKDIAKPKGKKAKTKQAAGAPSIPPAPIDERTIGVVSSPVAMSISSTCSSAHSSPSSVGQVSVSSRSTTRSDDRMYLREQSDHGKRSGMRPPPGLAPPPGFGSSGDGSEPLHRVGSSDGLPPVVPNLMSQTTEPTLSLGGGTELTSLVGNSLSSSGVETNMGAPLIVSDRPPVASSSPLLSSQTPLMSADTQDSEISNGFDVMDFLDNILGDQEPLQNEEESLGDLLAEKSSASIAAMPVSSDPWATERKSRAAAYGIHVEDEDDAADDATEDIVYTMLASAVPTIRTNGESMSSLQNSVPLLTPSAMLAANQVDSEDGEENSSAPLFKRGSFYSSLLKE